MRRATLTRTRTGDEGTFGRLVTDTGFVCFTGELPWRDNARKRSCIPPGRYICTWRHSELHGDCYHVEGAPVPWNPAWRTGIEIHAANWMGDVALMNPATGKPYVCELLGCIAPGTGIETLCGQRAVIASQRALRELENELAREPFELTVVG
jgi:hypothetical protein